MAAGDSFFLREKIKNILSMGIQKLLIDMDSVPYIDSTGVGFLVSSHTSITQEGGSLKLLKVKPKILEVFKLMNLLRIFEIFEDEDTAIKSFSQKAPPAEPTPPKKKKTVKAMKETE
jgi:anti-sigma B factor antagonist